MTATNPTAEELVRAVAGWIREIRPSLDERNAFLARVAENALSLVSRELTAGPAAEAAAAERLAAVLGHAGPHAELVSELCRALRTGETSAATPGLVAALKANALDQLAIDQPSYRHEGGI